MWVLNSSYHVSLKLTNVWNVANAPECKQCLFSNQYHIELHVIVTLSASGLVSGCGSKETSEVSAGTAGTLTCSSWLEHTSLCWCSAARKTLQPALFGCRDCGYKSKNTNSDPQEGFAIHCSTSRVYCGAFLIHKAAACKWGKTSPKSWRSKRHQHSSCSMSLLGLWAVHCVWYQQAWLENILKMINVAYFAFVRLEHQCMRF